MTEREAWIIFASSYGAREECSAIACAEFADSLLLHLKKRYALHDPTPQKTANEEEWKSRWTAREKRLAAKEARIKARQLGG